MVYALFCPFEGTMLIICIFSLCILTFVISLFLYTSHCHAPHLLSNLLNQIRLGCFKLLQVPIFLYFGGTYILAVTPSLSVSKGSSTPVSFGVYSIPTLLTAEKARHYSLTCFAATVESTPLGFPPERASRRHGDRGYLNFFLQYATPVTFYEQIVVAYYISFSQLPENSRRIA